MLSNEKNTFDITAEMTRQYKAMQENLMGKIGVLEGEIHKLKDELGERSAFAGVGHASSTRPHHAITSQLPLARFWRTR